MNFYKLVTGIATAAFVLAVGGMLSPAQAATTESSGDLAISSAVPAPEDSGTEAITITNQTDNSIDLDGYVLSDNGGNLDFTINPSSVKSTTTIEASGTYEVCGDVSSSSSCDAGNDGSALGLNDGGESSVTLSDGESIIAEVGYKAADVTDGESISFTLDSDQSSGQTPEITSVELNGTSLDSDNTTVNSSGDSKLVIKADDKGNTLQELDIAPDENLKSAIENILPEEWEYSNVIIGNKLTFCANENPADACGPNPDNEASNTDYSTIFDSVGIAANWNESASSWEITLEKNGALLSALLSNSQSVGFDANLAYENSNSDWNYTEGKTYKFNVNNPDTLYVDDGYSDDGDNDGHTWNQDAFATISDAVSAADTHDIIKVEPGNYTPNNPIEITKDNITLVGAGDSHGATIDFAGSNYGIKIENQSTTTIRGFTITNGNNSQKDAYAIRVEANEGGDSNLTVKDNVIENINAKRDAVGVSLDMDDRSEVFDGVVIEDNVIENITSTSNGTDGVEPEGNSEAGFTKGINLNGHYNNAEIKDNTVKGIKGYIGANVIDLSASNGNGPEKFTIENNTIDGVTVTDDSMGTAEYYTENALYLHKYGDLGVNTVTENSFNDGRVYYNTDGVGSPDELQATNNWWGSAAGPSAAKVSTNVDYRPYYVDADQETLSDNTSVKVATSTVDGSGVASTTISGGSSVKVDLGSTTQAQSVSVVESSGPTGDADSETGDNNTVYLDISTDSGSASGTITVTLDASQFNNPQEAQLKHYDGSNWNPLDPDVSISGSTATLTAAASSFSPFAVVDGPESSGGGGGAISTGGSSDDDEDGSDDGEVAGDTDSSDGFGSSSSSSSDSDEEESDDNDGRVLGESVQADTQMTDAEILAVLQDVLEQTLAIAEQLDMDVERLRSNY